MTTITGSKSSPAENLPINGSSSQSRCNQLARALRANQEATLSAQHLFNNVECLLTLSVRPRDGDSSLVIDLQDTSTTECWSANFDTSRMSYWFFTKLLMLPTECFKFFRNWRNDPQDWKLQALWCIYKYARSSSHQGIVTWKNNISYSIFLCS